MTETQSKPSEQTAAPVVRATEPASAAPFAPPAITASAAPNAHAAVIACPICGGPVDVRSRHVAVFGGAVRVYCSEACLHARDALPADTDAIELAQAPRRRRVRWLVAVLAIAGVAGVAFALLHHMRELREAGLVPPAPAIAVVETATFFADGDPDELAGLEDLDDPAREADTRLVADLMHDAWIHPLAGPRRRMPRNHTGAFGAARAGDRPPECASGHCGVDVGNHWGEPVYAVHDGVVNFVNRGPNEERGGVFVRIAHRGGTLFSWYFHLAAVPRSIHPGVHVRAGQMIGLLGDTGIKHSAPHLHFALSVKPSKHASEHYLDPEPLIAIWPLWIPNESHTGGTLATAEPGVPVRTSGRTRDRRGAAHVRGRGPRGSGAASASKANVSVATGAASAAIAAPQPEAAVAPPVTSATAAAPSPMPAAADVPRAARTN